MAKRINFRDRPGKPGNRKTFSERMGDTGTLFYLVAGLAAAAIYGLIFFMLAAGNLAGF